MARYTGPDCKRCRREKTKLFLKGAKCDRRSAPSRSGPTRRASTAATGPRRASTCSRSGRSRRPSGIYGVLEKQFHNYYEEAARKRGKTGEVLLQLLESRLDNVVYRAGFAKSRDMARQLVGHGHVLVNGRKVDIPSYRVGESDIVEVAAKSRELTPFVVARAEAGERPVAGLDRGHPGQDARAGAHAPGPGADRHAGPGAAHRRVLLEVISWQVGGLRRSPASPAGGNRRAESRLSYSGQRGKEQQCSSPSVRASPRSRSASSGRGSSSSRSSRASATPSATRSAAPCCPRSPVPPSPASGSRECCTSSPPSPASPRTSPTSS